MKPVLFILLLAHTISCNNGVDKKRERQRVLKDEIKSTRLVLDRPTYALSYLSDWTIDSSEKLENIKTHFTLHSGVESGLITVFIFDYPQDESETLQRHIDAQLNKHILNATVKYFTDWGSYKGHGVIVKGMNTASMPSKLEIFVYSNEKRSFLITSIYANEFEDNVLPGLNLIKASFKMK